MVVREHVQPKTIASEGCRGANGQRRRRRMRAAELMPLGQEAPSAERFILSVGPFDWQPMSPG